MDSLDSNYLKIMKTDPWVVRDLEYVQLHLLKKKKKSPFFFRKNHIFPLWGLPIWDTYRNEIMCFVQCATCVFKIWTKCRKNNMFYPLWDLFIWNILLNKIMWFIHCETYLFKEWTKCTFFINKKHLWFYPICIHLNKTIKMFHVLCSVPIWNIHD